MILLDTNVLSELMRPVPSVAVDAGLSGQPVAGTFISAITEAELRYGLALLPEGQRQRRLLAQAEAMLAEDFAGRILPFDSPAAVAYARIAADRRSAGRPRCADRGDRSVTRRHGRHAERRGFRGLRHRAD